jgi:hypothetical protein
VSFGEESESMSRISLKGLAPTITLLLVIASGYGAGSFLDQAACWGLVNLACLTAVMLSVAAWCRRPPSARERFVAVGLLAYLVAAVVSEALLFVQDVREVFVSVAWLSPLVLGGAVLPRRDAWFAAAGCWAILFGGVVALAYNVSHVESGVGFLWRWVS